MKDCEETRNEKRESFFVKDLMGRKERISRGKTSGNCLLPAGNKRRAPETTSFSIKMAIAEKHPPSINPGFVTNRLVLTAMLHRRENAQQA